MIKEEDHQWTPTPVCPHCGNKDEDWWDGTSLKNDGDSKDAECGSCGKEYRTEMSLTVDFSTSVPSQQNANCPATDAGGS